MLQKYAIINDNINNQIINYVLNNVNNNLFVTKSVLLLNFRPVFQFWKAGFTWKCYKNNRFRNFLEICTKFPTFVVL